MSKADDIRALREAKAGRGTKGKTKPAQKRTIRSPEIRKAVATIEAAGGRISPASHPDCARCNADREAARARMKRSRDEAKARKKPGD